MTESELRKILFDVATEFGVKIQRLNPKISKVVRITPAGEKESEAKQKIDEIIEDLVIDRFKYIFGY